MPSSDSPPLEDFVDLAVPTSDRPAISGADVSTGPPIPAQQRILLYNDSDWEEFVQEWAHASLKNQYQEVKRFAGTGDRGLDIVGFVDSLRLRGIWDNYQCKHYDHSLYPGDALPEIGKIIWHSFKDHYKPPRRSFFVAPRDIGTSLGGLLGDADALRAQLIARWDANIRPELGGVTLEGQLLDYLNRFDLSIFQWKTSLQLVDEHRQSPFHAARFGGGLRPRPAAASPPNEIAREESVYIGKLLEAYADHKKAPVPTVAELSAWRPIHDHFHRQREAFYEAESLRVFARDNVPVGTFESLQDDVFHGVADVCEADHADGYHRVRKVTEAARQLQITSNALITRSNPKDRDGICHQLANDDRLTWVRE